MRPNETGNQTDCGSIYPENRDYETASPFRYRKNCFRFY